LRQKIIRQHLLKSAVKNLDFSVSSFFGSPECSAGGGVGDDTVADLDDTSKPYFEARIECYKTFSSSSPTERQMKLERLSLPVFSRMV